MKNLIKITLFLALLPLAFSIAQKKDYSGEPGYINLSDLTKFESESKFTEVILEEKLLRLASKFSRRNDDELSRVLENIKLIQVYVIGVNEKNEKIFENRILEVNKKVQSKSWDRIIRHKDKDQIANVFIKTDANDNIVGLIVTALEKDFDEFGELGNFKDENQAVFLNIVGDIDLETIGRLNDKWDIHGLDKVKDYKGSSDENK